MNSKGIVCVCLGDGGDDTLSRLKSFQGFLARVCWTFPVLDFGFGVDVRIKSPFLLNRIVLIGRLPYHQSCSRVVSIVWNDTR